MVGMVANRYPPCAMAVERRIGFDLSVEGLAPGLHLPMLAGLAQGPGFPNLSCLGLLSDRILQAYVLPRPEGGTSPEARSWSWSAGHERAHDFGAAVHKHQEARVHGPR